MTTHNSIELNKRNVRSFLTDTHSGRLDIIDRVVSPDIVTHGFPGGPGPRNREQYKAFFADFERAFPNMDFTIDALVAEGDKVAVRWSISSVHAGPYAGFEASGRRVGFGGMVIYRMVNGQIAETWLYPDTTTLLRQLAGKVDSVAGSPSIP